MALFVLFFLLSLYFGRMPFGLLYFRLYLFYWLFRILWYCFIWSKMMKITGFFNFLFLFLYFFRYIKTLFLFCVFKFIYFTHLLFRFVFLIYYMTHFLLISHHTFRKFDLLFVYSFINLFLLVCLLSYQFWYL